MKKIALTILFSLLITTSVNAEKVLNEWKQLFALNSEEIQMLESMKNKNVHMQYRLFELYSEKARLEKQRENISFIKNKLKNSKLKRKNSFKRTLITYNKSKRLANIILKRFPKTRFKADIYYSLALNSRDFGYDGKTKYYLKLALKSSDENSSIHYQSLVSLAEYYYNNKKYKQAVKTYEKVIVNTRDSWHTKNLLNYGWCLFKAGKTKQAIYTLKSSFHKSKESKYINMNDQVIEGLSIFFVHNKSIEDGAEFFINNEKNAVNSLDILYSKLKRKGTLKSLENLLNISINYQKSLGLNVLSLEIKKLEVYKQYKSEPKFYKQLVYLKSQKLLNGDKLKINDLIKNVVGLMQIRLVKSYNRVNDSYQNKKFNRIQSYYDSMIFLDKKNIAYYTYLKAESNYGVHRYKNALVQYVDAIEKYKKTVSHKDIRRKAIDAIFSCIELSTLKKDYKKDRLSYGYRNFLNYWPNDKKAPIVYANYIKLLVSTDQVIDSEYYLSSFNKFHPKSLKQQQSLLRLVLDNHIKNERSIDLARWLTNLKGGKFKYSKKDINKLELVHTNILFNKIHKLVNKKKYDKAVFSYTKIYENPHFSNSIKSKASYFLITTNAKRGNIEDMNKWYEINKEISPIAEFNSHHMIFSEIQNQLIFSQELTSALAWNRMILKDFCSQKDSINDKLIERQFNLIEVLSIDESFSHFTNQNKKCAKNTNWHKLGESYLHIQYSKNNMDKVNEFLVKFSNNGQYKDINQKFALETFDYLLILDSKNLGDVSEQLIRLNCKECVQRVLSYKEANLLLTEVEYYKDFQFKFNKSFNEINFNSQIENEIERIKILITRIEHIKKYHYYYSTIHSMASLSNSLRYFSDAILKATPPIKDKNMLKDFKKQMNSLAQSFILKSNEYRLKAQLLVQNDKLLIKNSYIQKFIAKTSTNQLIPARYYATKSGL